MPQRPTHTIWQEMADEIGTDVATIRAVFEVEAAGQFFNADGTLVRRFEPHHFPRQHWDTLRYGEKFLTTAQKANARRRGWSFPLRPWHISVLQSTAAMFDRAASIDSEAAFRASSWGAPQIMGFNAELIGFSTATEMVRAFERSADEQVRGFVRFVVARGLDGHMRSQNWLAFAAGYNGNGQAAHYARLIEQAFRRHSGSPSAVTIRLGDRGHLVEELQVSLAALGYDVQPDGAFGPQTLRAVRAFQEAQGLKVDGIVGAATQRALKDAGASFIEPEPAERQETATEHSLDKMIERGGAILGTGGVTALVAGLNETAQQMLIGGVIVGVIVLGGLLIMRRRA